MRKFQRLNDQHRFDKKEAFTITSILEVKNIKKT